MECKKKKSEKKEEQLKEKRLEFRIWASSKLLQRGMTKVALAKELEIPLSRVCEAINGTGVCIKYIPMIIEHLGGNIDDFKELVHGVKE